MTNTVLLSAGGTGGHLFPAQALAQELEGRGWTVHLATDPRAEKYVASFPADSVSLIRSATFGGKSPVALARTLFQLASGYFASRKLLKRLKPEVVVGFGGYPTVPPLLAASHLHYPTVLHEQNAIMGRANRFLAGRVSAIASGFGIEDATGGAESKIVVTGNPLRSIAHEAAMIPYSPPMVDGPFNLLVFGGSQGARFFSQIVPKALALLSAEQINRLHLTLQARPEDAEQARRSVHDLNVAAEISDFFKDMPQRIARSHLVICRSGASSVCELALIGVPSILVPLPGSLDDDQGANASRLEEAGGATLVRQTDLTAQRLADLLDEAMQDPSRLAKQAENAKKAGVPDAAERLADLVISQVA